MPLVWPSLQSIAIAYWPTRLIPLARTFSGTVVGSSSGRPDVSSMHIAHRQARRRSRALYLVSWPSAHLIVMVDRSRPTISSGIGMAAASYPLPARLRRSNSFISGAACSACTKPPSSISVSISSTGTR